MSRCSWVPLTLLSLLLGCSSASTGADTRRYACTLDDECAAGFACRAGVCQLGGDSQPPPDEPGGPGDGGINPGTPPTRLAFVSPAQTVGTGQCSAAGVIETQTAEGVAAPVENARTMTLSGTGLTFFSNASCTTPLSNPVFAAGTARASFYFKGRSSGTNRLSAAVSGLSAVSQDETILPVVRSGVCTLPATGNSVTCPISPAQVDLSKTMLLISLSPSGRSPDSGGVRCVLSARDAFTCGRNAAAPSSFDIQWQTVELGTGLRVQHLQPSCQSTFLVAVPIQTVSPQKSFLLVSSEQSGTLLGGGNLYTATLADSGTRVELEFSGNCSPAWKGSLQVVEFEGIQVERGDGAMSGTQTGAGNAGLPAADLATTALLFTYQVNNAGAANLCDRVMRGEVSAPTELDFSRALGSSQNCTTAGIEAMSWERINFGSLARVQPVQVAMYTGQADASSSFTTAVDRTRAVVFASGQGMNGQAGGEASYSGDDVLGESLAGFSFYSATQLQAHRASTLGRARWTAYVVEFNPP